MISPFDDDRGMSYESLADIISNMLAVVIFIAVISVMLPRTSEDGSRKSFPSAHSPSENYGPEREVNLTDRTRTLPLKHLLNLRNQLFFFAYRNHLIYVDQNEIVAKFLDKLSDNMDGESVNMGAYRVRYFQVPEGDARNHWFQYELDMNLSVAKEPDMSDIEEYGIFQRYPPADTQVILISYPSAHELVTQMISRFKDAGFHVSWTPQTSRFVHVYGYSHQGLKVRVE